VDFESLVPLDTNLSNICYDQKGSNESCSCRSQNIREGAISHKKQHMLLASVLYEAYVSDISLQNGGRHNTHALQEAEK
jgi:hypothetical protein